jgi:hypothetical protein
MLEGGFGENLSGAPSRCKRGHPANEKGLGASPRPFCARPRNGPWISVQRPKLRGYDLRNWSNERDTWLLIGSVVSAAILVVSALISFAWLANTSNCLRMKAD